MNKEDIKSMSIEELSSEIETQKKQLSQLKVNHAVAPLENPIELKKIRKNIARLLTQKAKLS